MMYICVGDNLSQMNSLSTLHHRAEDRFPLCAQYL